jgi:hypothetical protein
MAERITRAEFARRANVNKSTVTRWIESGRITLGADGLLDEAEAHRQRAASESPAPHHQARKAQFDLERQPNPTAGGVGTPQRPVFGATATTTPATRPVDEAAGDLGGDPLDLPTPQDADEVVRRTRYAQMLEREAVARMKAREDQEAAGQLLRRASVLRTLTDATSVIINTLETLDDRLAPQLVAIEDQARIRAILRSEFEQAGATIADQLARAAEASA